MGHLFRVGLVTVLLGAFLACDLEQEITGPEVSMVGSALTTEAAPETGEILVVEGEEAMKRFIEELKRSSPRFAAAVDGIVEGSDTSGDRVVLEAPTPIHGEDCLTDMVSPDDDKVLPVSTDVAMFQDPDTPRSLLEYISAGVPESDLERLDQDDSPLPTEEEPVFSPFSY